MCMIGRLFFGRIFVDDIDPARTRIIIVQCYNAIEARVQRKIASSAGEDDVGQHVIDSGERLNAVYSLVIWTDNETEFDASSFSFIDPDHTIPLRNTK